jgi:NCAIR mutase (PurE)-related protein
MKNIKDKLNDILYSWKNNTLGYDDVLEKIKTLFVDDIGIANLDIDRKRRRGFPETIMAEGKSLDDLKKIVGRLFEKNEELILITRVELCVANELTKEFKDLNYEEKAKILYHQKTLEEKVGKISLITAGTSDNQVAEEARVTASIMGNNVETIYDVGISGIHRLYLNRKKFEVANVGIVIAGMEGALPSFVAGLVDYPVIAVPTSVGYGANLGGFVALLSMINSCVPGVCVVNIDNGYGAAYIASMINRNIEKRK